jgi:hypothetical protein
MENQQVAAMKKLGMTDEEIADVLESDKRIDKGEKLFELTPEEEKAAKKARQADRKKPTEPVKRERKVDTTKRELIDLLFNTLENAAAQNIVIENPERELTFIFHGKKYKLVLSAPRS